MAYVVKDTEEEKKKEDVSSPEQPKTIGPAAGGGDISITGAPAAPTAPGQAKPETQRQSGRFTDLSRYVKVAEPSQLSEKIGTTVGKEQQAARQALQNLSQGFLGKVAEGSVQARPELVQQYIGAAGKTDEPSKKIQEEFKTYQQRLEQGYKGPTDISQVGDFGNVQKQYQQLSGKTGLLETEAGRKQLLEQEFGKPTYTAGQKRFDQLLLQTDPQARARFAALQNLSGELGGDIQKASTQASQLVPREKQAIQAAREDILYKLMGSAPATSTPAGPQVGAYVAGQTGQVEVDPVTGLPVRVTTPPPTVTPEVLASQSPELQQKAQNLQSKISTAQNIINQFQADKDAADRIYAEWKKDYRVGKSFQLPDGRWVPDFEFVNWAANIYNNYNAAKETLDSSNKEYQTLQQQIQANQPVKPKTEQEQAADIETQIADLQKQLAEIGTPAWEERMRKISKTALMLPPEQIKKNLQAQIDELRKAMPGGALAKFEGVINDRVASKVAEIDETNRQIMREWEMAVRNNYVVDPKAMPTLSANLGQYANKEVNLKSLGYNLEQYMLGWLDRKNGKEIVNKYNVMTPDEKQQYLSLARTAGIPVEKYFVSETQQVGGLGKGAEFSQQKFDDFVKGQQRVFAEKVNAQKQVLKDRMGQRGNAFLQPGDDYDAQRMLDPNISRDLYLVEEYAKQVNSLNSTFGFAGKKSGVSDTIQQLVRDIGTLRSWAKGRGEKGLRQQFPSNHWVASRGTEAYKLLQRIRSTMNTAKTWVQTNAPQAFRAPHLGEWSYDTKTRMFK